jgi:hypothetical protein
MLIPFNKLLPVRKCFHLKTIERSIEHTLAKKGRMILNLSAHHRNS